MGTTYSTNDDDEEPNRQDDHPSESSHIRQLEAIFQGSSTTSFLGPSWLVNDSTQPSFFDNVFRGVPSEPEEATPLPPATPRSSTSTSVIVDPIEFAPTGGPLISLDEVFQATHRQLLQPQITSNSDEAGSIQFCNDDEYDCFQPHVSRHFEWMGRSVESLILGHVSATPILALPEDDDLFLSDTSSHNRNSSSRRASVDCTELSPMDYMMRRSSLDISVRGSMHVEDSQSVDSQQGSLSTNGSSHHHMQGGTLANYYNQTNRRRRSIGVDLPNISYHRATSRRRNIARCRVHTSSRSERRAGPNIVFSLFAREITGYSKKSHPASHRLKLMGGRTLYQSVDKPGGGMLSEVHLLDLSVQRRDWTETAAQITRLATRLVGDGNARGTSIDDPNVPATASPYHAGGGRLGLERDAFCFAGGVQLLISIFREPAFIGEGRSNDARDLPTELVANKLAPCWNETLATLRELAYTFPVLVKNGTMLESGDFLPFLFTLLSHDITFDGAATLIEEILSLQSHAPPPAHTGHEEGPIDVEYRSMIHTTPVSTFFLGNVPRLYELWRGFNCRQLAHFCRILALLVFEPEDRHLLESPAVLKSLELLQLRRDRAVRAGRDSTVDMNQAILLGDRELMHRLLKLLKVMNYAPTLRRTSAYHVMAHFPFIGDTLIMLGLSEIDNWNEIERLEMLARKLVSKETKIFNLSDLGSVTDMLESLSGPLLRNPMEPSTQLGHIIHVINAARRAGVVVGQRIGRRQRDERPNRTPGSYMGSIQESSNSSIDPISLDYFATATMTLTDQVIMRRALFASPNGDESTLASSATGVRIERGNIPPTYSRRIRINTPEDAANELQFNAMILAPYQVEVLFVLCTLLGGRRKVDAQNFLNINGLITTLDEMFHRLSWGTSSSRQQSTEISGSSYPVMSTVSDPSVQSVSPDINQVGIDHGQEQPYGIHGPGCECTPESALSIQYLRLLHNFCDRDSDNYSSRRLLLSEEERDFIFLESNVNDHLTESLDLNPGLFTKVLGAFMQESDDSPYRFWLASCAESYIRGSSPQEQLFAARSGLLVHIVEDIISDKLHCAGSLQTSFDLLGELCKGNSEVLHLLVSTLDEDTFRKIMSAAAANLVDSNVFIRSLLLSLERIATNKFLKEYERKGVSEPSSIWINTEYTPWIRSKGHNACSYLTHSWWDMQSISRQTGERRPTGSLVELAVDEARSPDWFTFRPFGDTNTPKVKVNTSFNSSVGYNGWVFSPDNITDALCDATYSPNTIERLAWFLTTNQARLLRDLLGVVDLRNINHENICCLNTAVIVAIFAFRRDHLAGVLNELRRMRDEDTNRRADPDSPNGDVEISEVMKDMGNMELGGNDLRRSIDRYFQTTDGATSRRLSTPGNFGDCGDALRNFRELLWFWSEYYLHRGRDRLSLEFSSHVRFQEWKKVVSLLGTDDGSPLALTRRPVRLPKSPYQQASLLRHL